ncbi:hypothetical protein [Streptococcus equinus]|uniref:ApeA N-terminal domain 1-containing protein n=1 Tax=Streptococcus equinus TaxID=1335 RepID=UPI0012FBE8C0|nr:hypothetical protein [Streptococcus equinus]QGX44944.1 hypothetical protein GO596_06390 [Streptococcus equinus]
MFSLFLFSGGKSAYSIGENYGVYNDSDSGTLIYEDDNVNIKYHVRGTMLPVHESELFKDKIELIQRTLIEIEFSNETFLDNFFNLFEKIKRLIELTLVGEIVVHKIQGLSNLEFDLYDSEHKSPRTLDISSPIIRKDRFKGNYYGLIHLRKRLKK